MHLTADMRKNELMGICQGARSELHYPPFFFKVKSQNSQSYVLLC